ncbi:hypothetical protein Vadar_023885 [Vaccinium darrowii]|uniref:Uncharacterized protein n=1 Tax=Vaccinium darrowii TaxID=229202 RepID=A0ACB7YGP0_9ERIC|nr:hypothetical protein Vadar_023885 [Vaccinium darrowii]
MGFYLPLLILLWPTAGTAAQQPPSAAAQTPPSTDYTDYLNMTAVVIFVVLVFTVFLAAIITIYIRDCSDETRIPRYSSSSTAAARALRLSSSGLDRAAIDSFPILNYSEIKHLRIGKGALSCAVCVSEFEEDETLRWLPKCDHVFHPECIDPWLASHSTCPLCRANLSRRIESTQSTEERNSTADVCGVRNQNQISIIVDGNQRIDTEPIKRVRMFPRPHSTGHSLVRLGEDCEMYTLRLPEGVRRQVERLDRGGTSDRRFCMTPPPFPSGTGFLWSARVGVVDNDVTVVESSKAFPKSPLEYLDGKSVQ